ncbi:MAG: RDD family protein [Elusimicrobia bacterium]|nr:RDD family protein [Elusimicrobiota bacterium]
MTPSDSDSRVRLIDEEEVPEPQSPAHFFDRLAAFALDFLFIFLLFYSGLFIASFLFKIAFDIDSALVRYAGFLALFTFYGAYFSSGGRRTIGKRIFGLRVCDWDGAPLRLSQALARSFGYIPSSPLCLGFLWALRSPGNRAWHDILAGSRVVETRTKGFAAHLLSGILGACVLAAMAGLWSWYYLAAPYYYQMRMVAGAKMSLQSLAALKEAYYKEHGAYSASLRELADFSGSKGEIIGVLKEVFERQSLKIEVRPEGYTFRGRVKNADRTEVILSGPQPPSPGDDEY